MATQSFPAAPTGSSQFYMPSECRFADLLGWATIVVEIVGGLLILAGAFIPMAAAPMIVVLLVAIFTVHLPNGFSSIKLMSYDAAGAHFGQPGYETDLLYIAGLLALCIGGPGPLSVDGYLKGRGGPVWRSRPEGGATVPCELGAKRIELAAAARL